MREADDHYGIVIKEFSSTLSVAVSPGSHYRTEPAYPLTRRLRLSDLLAARFR
jgi:hypothetical protein